MGKVFTGLFGLFFVAAAKLAAQANFADIPSSSKVQLYFDDFSSNAKDNLEYNGSNEEYKVTKGVYRMENKTDGTWIKFLLFDPTCNLKPSLTIDEKKNFEIEVSVRFVSGTDNRDISLIWGADRPNCDEIIGERYVGFSGNGYYIVYENDRAGTHTEPVPWVESSLVSKTGFNKLTVRKYRNEYFMFVNEHLVHRSSSAAGLYGQHYGIAWPAKTIVEVDYINVSYLPAEITHNPYYDFGSGDRIDIYYDTFSDNSKGNYQGEGDNSKCTIKDGVYRLENKTDGPWVKFITLDPACEIPPYLTINEKKNFEIETSIRFVSGDDNHDISLTWGTDRENCASIYGDRNLGFSGNGYYLYYEHDRKGDIFTPLEWTESTTVIQGGFNKLTVRKVGPEYLMFLNEKLVHRMSSSAGLFGQHNGITWPAKSVVELDYFRVSYLNAAGPLADQEDTPAQSEDVTEPEIILVSPVTTKNATITVFQNQLMISGYAKDPSGIKNIAINTKPVTFNKQGYFETLLELSPGNNFVTLKAEDNQGNIHAMAFNCERQDARNLGAVEEEVVRTNPNQKVLSSSYLKGRRVALVIGNKSYTKAPALTNSVNDAMDMATTLKNRGFEVISLYDAKTKTDIRNAIVKFTQAIRGDPNTVSLFYYSGHGMQIDGVNYLVPTDANLEIKADVDDQCMNMDFVMRAMDETDNPLKIVILDACRNNPFRSFSRSGEQGLSMVDAPKGTYIVFATKPGSVASDGTGGRNGLFTSKLLQYINTENLTLEEVFKKVAAEVAKDSEDRQRPWISSDFTGEFYFNMKN